MQQRDAADTRGPGTKCHVCRKRIVWPGLCYTCATGRPRTLFQPEERALLAAAADAAGEGAR